MSEAKFTRGPWINRKDIEGALTVLGEGQKMVALVYGQDLTQRLANGDLVSAAPDLLEALEAVADSVCALHCASQWMEADGRPPCSATCQKVRAVIAKALGEAK